MIFVHNTCDRTKVWRADEGFFSGAKIRLALPRHIFHPVSIKEERRCWQEDRGLPPWPSVQPRPKNTVLGLRFQSLTADKLKVHHSFPRWSSISSYSVPSQMPRALNTPFVPRKRSSSNQKYITCRLSHGFSLHPSFPYFSVVSK